MQRVVAIFAVVLCAAQPSGCGPDAYVAAPLADTPTTPLTMPSPEVTLIELPEDEAWRRVKSTLGSRVLVLKPTVIPARLASGVVMLEYAYLAGEEVRYRVGYRSEDALVLFSAGAVNSAGHTTTLPVDVHGVTGQYSRTSGWPEQQIHWVEAARALENVSPVLYTIQTRGVTEDELFTIARGLVSVP